MSLAELVITSVKVEGTKSEVARDPARGRKRLMAAYQERMVMLPRV